MPNKFRQHLRAARNQSAGRMRPAGRELDSTALRHGEEASAASSVLRLQGYFFIFPLIETIFLEIVSLERLKSYPEIEKRQGLTIFGARYNRVNFFKWVPAHCACEHHDADILTNSGFS